MRQLGKYTFTRLTPLPFQAAARAVVLRAGYLRPLIFIRNGIEIYRFHRVGEYRKRVTRLWLGLFRISGSWGSWVAL
jgi:hypothetical protein